MASSFVFITHSITNQTQNTSATDTMSSSLPMPLPDDTFKLTLRMHHLEQLRNVDIPAERIPGPPFPLPPEAPSPYDQLVEWSKEASVQIADAVSKRQCSLPICTE